MKYMTFNNSCFYAAIANLLEEYNIDIQDNDIIKESLIPYMFKYDEDNECFLSGYQVQDKGIINDYLKKYILKLKEKRFTEGTLIERKKSLIKSLTESESLKIVSLKLIDNQNKWHATIYQGMSGDKYTFSNMRRRDDEIIEIVLTYGELLNKLADTVQFAWIERDASFQVLNKKVLLDDSLNILEKMHKKIIAFCEQQQSYKNRLIHRDKLFKPLLLNYIDIAKIVGENRLYVNLLNLQKSYLETFKIEEKIAICDYIDISLLSESIVYIRDLINNNKHTKYYHGSKTSGITKLYPNLSIHGEKYVYLTTKKEVALIYTVNAIESYYEKNNLEKPQTFHPWYSYGFTKGKLHIDEYYENAFEETYKGKPGFLYVCSEPKKDISNKTNIFCAVTTREEINVIEEIFVEDLYIEFLDLESKGIIEIRRYEDWTNEQLIDIKKSIKGTIKHFDLDKKPNYHYTKFLKDKFPDLF